jgi:hypothetical protein
VGKRSKGNPRNRHGEWALEEKARAKPKHSNNKTSRGSKQKLKATSEETNKSQQTLGLRKQKPTSD